MRALACMGALLLGCLAGAQPLEAAIVLDRTFEREPLVFTSRADLTGVTIVDRNPNRPAIVAKGCDVKGTKIVRLSDGDVYRSHPPRPASLLNYSHHDYAEAGVVLFGKGTVDFTTIEGNVAVLVLPYEDGRYGEDSVVKLRYLRNHVFGVLASGQRRLTVTVSDSKGYLWPDPERVKNSHAFYANRCMFGGRFMRLTDPKVRIGKSRAVPMGGATEGMHPTAKFTGSWGVDYECLDDQNPGGAGDFNMSSGLARIRWKHPGVGFHNPVFTGLRLADGGDFGKPPFDFGVVAEVDDRLCPDRQVPSIAVHVKDGGVSSLGVRTTGKVDVYSMASGFRILRMEIEK